MSNMLVLLTMWALSCKNRNTFPRFSQSILNLNILLMSRITLSPPLI